MYSYLGSSFLVGKHINHGLLSEVRVQLGHFVLVHLVELRVDLFFGIHNILPEKILRDGFHITNSRREGEVSYTILLSLFLSLCLCEGGVVTDMATNYKLGQILIL